MFPYSHEMNSFRAGLGTFLKRRTCPNGSTVLLSWPRSAPQAEVCLERRSLHRGLAQGGGELAAKILEPWALGLGPSPAFCRGADGPEVASPASALIP